MSKKASNKRVKAVKRTSQPLPMSDDVIQTSTNPTDLRERTNFALGRDIICRKSIELVDDPPSFIVTLPLHNFNGNVLEYFRYAFPDDWERLCSHNAPGIKIEIPIPDGCCNQTLLFLEREFPELEARFDHSEKFKEMLRRINPTIVAMLDAEGAADSLPPVATVPPIESAVLESVTQDGRWVSSDEFRENHACHYNKGKIPAQKTIQDWRYRGKKADDKMSGCDVKGNIWAKNKFDPHKILYKVNHMKKQNAPPSKK